jgi:caa(3)-type oxidase subunit IV
MSDPTTANTPAAAPGPVGHDDHHEHDWSAHIRTYIIVGVILFVGTITTVIAAYHIDLHDRARNITLGLTIATFKCSLVALIFMHLKNERTLIYKFLLFTAIFFGAMMFLFLSAQNDPLPADASGNMVHHGHP